MADTITFWGIAIPSAVASSIGALVMWFLNHRSAKAIKAIESRLHREEEAFRLVHSPRVTTAVKVWCAFCEFERCVNAAISPANIVHHREGVSREEQNEDSRRQILEQQAAWMKAVAAAWGILKQARDEAEVLLDDATFKRLDALYKACDSACADVWAARLSGDLKMLVEATSRAFKNMENVRAEREDVVRAIRHLIAASDQVAPAE